MLKYFIVVIVGLLPLVFSKKRSIFFVVLFFLCLLATFNFDNPDRANYFDSFNRAADGWAFYGLAEVGQQFIYQIFNRLGFGFNVFLGIYYFIAFALIARFILRYTDNPGYVLVLYFIYPYFMDVVQLRTLMTTAIVINAIPYLSIKSKAAALKYLLLICLAGTIHYSVLFFLLLLFFRKISVRKLIIASVFIVIISVFFNDIILQWLMDSFPFLERKLLRYTRIFQTSIYTKVGLLIYFSAGLFLVYMALLKFKNRGLKKYVDKDGKMSLDFVEVILKANILIFFLFPFLMFALEFIRLYRPILILNYVLFSNVIFVFRKSLTKDIFDQILIFLFVVLTFGYFVLLQFSDTVLFSFFEYNYLLP
ncbi:MAG: EpsG family protein [Salinivirgaceae bacterium]